MQAWRHTVAKSISPVEETASKRRHRGWWVSVVVVLSMFVAACGGSADPSTSTGDAGSGESTTSLAEASGGADGKSATTTTSTTAAEATTTTADDEVGTFESPIRAGEFAQVGDWKVRVIDVIPDATDIVMAENSFNDPPVEGNQFFVATLEAEYTGTESGNFWVDMEWKAVGPSAVAYEAWEATCGVFPGSIDEAGETFPSGVIAGGVCWSVSADDAADLVMLLDNTFSFDDSERTVYDLDPEMTPVEPSEGASADLSQVPAVEVGEFAQVGDWKIRVIDVIPDATEAVMAENSFNDPPVEGNQFFVATLEAEYTGAESGSFWIDMEWKAVGPSAVAYEAFEATCGVYPDAIDEAGETFPSGVISGNVCWSVSTDDAVDLVMLLGNTFSFDDSERLVYSLTSGGAG